MTFLTIALLIWIAPAALIVGLYLREESRPCTEQSAATTISFWVSPQHRLASSEPVTDVSAVSARQ